MKKQIGSLDATPSKRLYLSIISDYDLNTSICELVDNAIDIWIKGGKKKKINIDIELDTDQQVIKITDDIGGIKEEYLKNIISPGGTSNVDSEETIGLFGVGSKRAAVALAQLIKITSRYKNFQTFSIEYDDLWIKDENNWEIEYYKVNDINESTTVIELLKLRNKLDKFIINNLKKHLNSTYFKFFESKNITIKINGESLEGKNFEIWAYPPGYEPCEYETIIATEEGEKINVKITGGLSKLSSPAGGEYGVYFYCNDRLISKEKKDSTVGFISGVAGHPHPSMSIVRIFVMINGPAKLMPWNSSKSDINTNSEIYKNIKEKLFEVLKYYAKLSKSLNWEFGVFPYTDGVVKKVSTTNIKDIKVSKLLKPPKKNLNYEETIKRQNSELSKNKPWVIGLYESVIAAHIIFNKDLKQKNRIALIILDSTLEIAFKEYLIHECSGLFSAKRLYEIFQKRDDMINEVKKILNPVENDWKAIVARLNYYYHTRCKLVHEKADSSISDEDIIKYNEILENLLSELFGLEFEIDIVKDE